jgi:alginate O-acetyltransferase complex protein AlgI
VLFNSLVYAAFLPAVLALYFQLSQRWQNRMLLAASYLFYGWWDERFLFLMMCSTAFDYLAGLVIERGRLARHERLAPTLYLVSGAFVFVVLDWSAIGFVAAAPFLHVDSGRLIAPGAFGWKVLAGTIAVVSIVNLLLPLLARLTEAQRRRVGMAISLVGNLGLLAFFKYFDFFVESAEAVVRSLGFDPQPLRLNLVLPVGISFYTFQSLSYTIDVYRRQIPATSRFLDFALFVAYFPQLVAGPIERATQLIPRLQAQRRVRMDDMSGGAYLILLGLFKKMAIADGVGPAVSSVFNSAGTPSWAEVIFASSLFVVQLYCDFSGYSDIARGSSRLMGIPLMVNFRLPLLAATPADFWGRWHLSLTTWLRDYLYYSLGANRRKDFEMYRNLFITMCVAGLWHGAAWTFVVWGALEGVLMVLDRWLLGNRFGAPKRRAPGFTFLLRRLPFILLFFYFHLVSSILFRSPSWDKATQMLGVYAADVGNLSFQAATPTASALLGIPLLLLLETCEYAKNRDELVRTATLPLKALVYAAMVLLIVMGSSNASRQFIYFQF